MPEIPLNNGSGNMLPPSLQPAPDYSTEAIPESAPEKAPEPSSEIFFADVVPGSYYEEAVSWAVQNGITMGTGEGSFSPEKECSRAEIITFLYRAFGSPEVIPDNSFYDVVKGSYYESAVSWAVWNGITTGTGDGLFSPNAECSRAQIVVFLYRAFKSPAVSENKVFSDVLSGSYYESAVSWALCNGITTGIGTDAFGPDAVCSRAQAVSFLFRAIAG